MKVVIDDKIPFIKGVLEDVAQVKYLSSELITADAVRDALYGADHVCDRQGGFAERQILCQAAEVHRQRERLHRGNDQRPEGGQGL